MKNLTVFLITFIAASAIDALWHLVIFGNIYRSELKEIGKSPIIGWAGLVSQILVIGTITFLVLYKNTELKLIDGALIGAGGGILAITVYGTVNYALLKGWNLNITILEVIWGPLIGGLTGLFVTWLRSKL